jgi:hypothetical protein
MKEKPKMTDEQKDVIVKAAQELEKHWRGYGVPASDSMGKLLSAVRAAEANHPRWTLDEKGGLYNCGVYANVGAVFGGNEPLMKLIAELLNAYDDTGGK